MAAEPSIAASPRHVFEIVIGATPQRVWEGITNPDLTERYYHGTRIISDWGPGSTWAYVRADGSVAGEGTVIEFDPPRRLVTTFRMLFDEHAAAERPSRVSWELEPVGDGCRLRVTHDDFDGETATYRVVGQGKLAILLALKELLERGIRRQLQPGRETRTVSKPSHIYHVYIRTTPERLWQAITDPEMTRQYFHGTRMVGDFTPGSPYVSYLRDGRLAVEGQVLKADPPRKLVISWHFLYNPELAAQAPSRVAWEIDKRGDTCFLTVTHDELDETTSGHVSEPGGWPFILSNLKSLLETGQPLTENLQTLGESA